MAAALLLGGLGGSLLEGGARTAPAARATQASLLPQVLNQLALADQQWRPRVQPLPGGGLRYVYRRRPGDPELSLEQIKQRLLNPPSFRRERALIVDLWTQLSSLGLRLELDQPRKSGAAAEWDPAAATVRIKPAVLRQGSRAFARVLNHETIHVAQSCAAGSISSGPQLLGLAQVMPSHLKTVLQAPAYARSTVRERRLEQEAYANQDNLELGLSLLQRHC